MIYNIAIFVITYLICSISPSIEICKKKTGEDIRNLGSGNPGTTNSIRVLGKLMGFVVLILDMIKVIVAYGIIFGIAKVFKQDTEVMFNSLFMIAAITGHCYPIYYGFRGGKGVVTILVVGLLLNSQVALVCIIAGIVIILITRTVSIGSIGGVILFNIMIFVMLQKYILPVFIVSLIILFKHRKNITRIIHGEENKLF
ncbi:MAG: glycerol-3-phosphate 1-O-acyltransferase PlsY [Clostridia bacterium]|nr:glycerol-3-phosphate 1-O-acyltransferase PlsY [Clostridia bacterium]MDD4386609.1 glycerol-3-phosphate 1-O-acyltransferase PlsY [Clostridia bacterium]